MNEENKFNKILYTSRTISNKNLQHDIRLKMGLECYEIYNNLSTTNKNNLKSNMYIIYRELGALYFESNNYIEAENFFEKSLSIKYKNINVDSLVNECITKQMLSKVKMMIFLNTGNKKKLKEANELITFMENQDNNDWSEYFKNKVIETKKMYESVINNDIYTIVTFEIPYHLIISDEEQIEFKYNDTLCTINSKTIRSKSSGLIIGNNIYTEKDKYGIVNHSIITISLNKYINGNELVQVNSAVGKVYAPLKEAIETYNYFLRKYIISTGKYWLSEINENMIFNFETTVLAGKEEIKKIPLSISMSLSANGQNNISLDKIEIEKIKKELLNSCDELWKLSLNNAKDYFLIKDYKNAIVMLNISLENFSYSYAKNILKSYISEDKVEKFLNGKVEYDNFFLKDYIKEDDFIIAKEKELINDNPPTIYKIYAECYKYHEFPISKTQLNKKISAIKDQRNEIVHGKKISKDLKYVAEKAIEEFESLLNLIYFSNSEDKFKDEN